MTTLSDIITPTNLVTATGTQTLTNKTLTAPTIASANLTTALTLAGAAGTNGQVLTSAGSGLPNWTTLASGLAAATQAEMEAATSNTVAATPSKTQYHPGVAKAWVNCSGSGVTINGSYNISSIVDNGTGQLQVLLDTDMSSVNYAAVGFIKELAGRETLAVETQQAGLIATFCRNSSGTLADPDKYYFAFFGDQA
jgi:hypothetical protein